MYHALTARDIRHPQAAELLAAQAVIEQGRQDGAISHTFKRIGGRRFQQPVCLRIAQRRG